MNNGIFKLVFSKALNMYVPASEAAKSTTCKSKGRRARGAIRKASLQSFVASGLLLSATSLVWAADSVPVGLSLSNYTGGNVASTLHSLTFTQSIPKAILNWNTLNLKAGDLLQFKQGNRSWSALNRINDLSPSLIDGNVLADGNVYFINTNGIIFGKNSQINVGTLYASSLNITDEIFNNGLLKGSDKPIFTGTTGFVLVEEGAHLYAASGGRVILLAPALIDPTKDANADTDRVKSIDPNTNVKTFFKNNETVTNSGVIETPDGQTILAAGNKVYLQALTDKDLAVEQFKGLELQNMLVEVDSGGTATNLGKIISERGNTTLIGLAVNQQGTITASTSVRANGTVKLIARDTVTSSILDKADNKLLSASNGGTVTLGKDSVTEVKLDTVIDPATGKEVLSTEEISKGQADSAFVKSKVFISAANVDVEGKIIAKGGNVTISNRNDNGESIFGAGGLAADSHSIYLGHNSLIDVSGVDAIAPMERNQLEIQLYSDQLKDVPLLRGSDLYKQTVYVDARKITSKGNVGTDLTDVTPFLKLKNRTVAELMTSGGTVKLDDGAIQRTGSVIDVSGGTTTYAPGSIKETKLSVNGKSYLISEINADTAAPVLADSFSIKDNKWGVTRVWNLNGGGTEGWGNVYASNNLPKASVQGALVEGYKEGSNAGEIAYLDKLNAADTPAIKVQEGKVEARTYVGELQRAQNNLPKGGTIVLSGDFSNVGETLPDSFGFGSTFTDSGLRKANMDFLNNGFNNVRLNGKINSTAKVAPNGNVVLNADVNADIIAPGTNVTINNAVADGVKVTTAGLFTNDTAGVAGAQSLPVTINAGNIKLGDSDPAKNIKVSLGKNVTLDASAGAWQDNKGTLHKGSAGDIAINLTDADLPTGTKLQSYGFDKGGNLTIVTPRIFNVAGVSKSDELNLAANFFQQGGFSTYTINSTASGGNFMIGNGGVTDIYSNMQTWLLNTTYKGKASGEMALVASPWLAPDYLRKASSVSFLANAGAGTLTLDENATIRTDAGGKVTLAAGKGLTILGDISTPAGEINLNLTGDIYSGVIPYNPVNGIFIGEHANLNAAGVYRTTPSNNGLINAEVLKGGSINVSSTMGAVVLKEGSELDVSAANGVKDTKVVAGYQRETLYGDAGSIAIKTKDGLMLDGDLKGNAQGSGRGASLTLTTQSKTINLDEANKVPSTGTDFKITQSKVLTAQNLKAGDALLPATNSDAETLAFKGNAQISAAQITQGGFDNLSLQNNFGNAIEFDAGTTLNVPGTVSLASPQITVEGSGNATINASYVALKAPESNQGGLAYVANPLNNQITINADQIRLEAANFNNVNRTVLNAKLDINGGNTKTPGFTSLPNLVAPEEIDLTARNIYPETASQLDIQALGVGSKILVNNSGVAAKPVLSAQGTLNLTADTIEQNGTLKAPFGEINLNAAKILTLGDNSLTSVSSEGQSIPFGTTTLSGKTYKTSYSSSVGDTTFPDPSDKAIHLKSDKINQKAGAKVDLSGGGDMFAYEWIPGIGGSTDVLSQPNYFAVSPTIGKDYAPTDSVYQTSSASVKAGDAVYLTGIDGLPSGTYTLLPARYALMPGAFLVKAGATSTLLPGQSAKQVDGSSLTTGYRENLGTGAHDATWSSFNVVSGDIFRPAAGVTSTAPSEYKITSANTFYANKNTDDGLSRRLAQDAGQLTINATSQLDLSGQVIANKPSSANGALVDIASDNIRVVANKDADTSSLQLKATDLNNINSDSLLLGGTRTTSNGVTTVESVANQVSFENNASTALKVPELIATAKDTITVKSGAVISNTAATSTSKTSNIQTNGDGAFLAVSGVNDISYTRNRTGTSTQGTLNIESGSSISAGKSLVIDASKDAALKGTVKVADGGSATFGANSILLGNPSPAVVGLNISNTTLAELGKLSKLALNSANSVDIYGAVDFGNKDLDLSLNSAGVVGHLASGETVNLTARNLELKNSVGATYTAPSNAIGTLNITAANVRLAGKDATDTSTNNGKTVVAGFSEANVNSNELRFAKTGDVNFDVTKTTINTGRVTADTGADYTVKATGELTTATLATAIANSSTAANKDGLGAKVSVEANKLTIGGLFDLAAGFLKLNSKNDDLTLTADANISTKSAQKTFYDKTVSTPAGTVTLQSDKGNVSVNAGALVDVSSLDGANAGKVNISAISAGKTVNVLGTIKGTAGADATGKVGTGATLNLDVDKLADINLTNQQVTGFDESRQYRVRNDNVTIAATGDKALKSKEVIVTADNGSINVTGDIDASSAKNSHIGLFAKNDVTIKSGANVVAKTSNTDASGGKVEIGTTAGTLDLQAGANIDVHGAGASNTGEVSLRAPRTSDNLDIQIAHVEGVSGAKKVQAEGVQVYDASTLSDANLDSSGQYYADAASFMASAYSTGHGLDRIKSTNALLKIVPGIEVQNVAGDIDLPTNTLGSGYSFYNWRYDPETGAAVSNIDTGLNNNQNALLAGVLTLRASNNLNIHDTLSDGFASADLFDGTANGLNAWTYHLVAGADVASANRLSTQKADPVAATNGNVTLDAGKGVRTGSGDINIAAGGNLVMGDSSSVIYTAGHKDTEDVSSWFSGPIARANPQYLTNGGNINVQVQNNIVGAEPLSARQLVTSWLYRQGGVGGGGTSNVDSTWWVRPDLFKQSLATFGGGDVNISAGGDISNFSAAAASNGRFDSNGTSKNSKVNGGGDVTLNAGGDINNGVYYVAKGEGNIIAGGSVQKSGDTFGTTLALQDAQFNVSATKDIFIEGIINPTLFNQASSNTATAKIVRGSSGTSFYNTYGENAYVNLTDLSKSISLGNLTAFTNPTYLLGLDGNGDKESLPASLNLTSFGGDINVINAKLLPSQKSNLNLLAENNIKIDSLVMSDADPSSIPSAFSPAASTSLIVTTGHAKTLLHANDQTSVMIVAQNGSISNNSQSIASIDLPKSAKIVAGGDINNLSATVQNVHADDVTLVKAGHDIKGTNPSVTVAGPGELLVEAGRTIDLGTGTLASTANTSNNALPKDGASITVETGLGAKGATLDSYIAQYILPTGAGPAVLQGDATKLAAYRTNTANGLTAYMRKIKNDSSLTDAQALAAFNGLPKESKSIFAYRHFSSEVLASAGSVDTTPAVAQNKNRAYDAIAALFPQTDNHGDLLMFKGSVTTASNSSIDIVVPNGSVIAGLPGGGSGNGIITQKGGAIRAYADAGFEVNTSKVISQFGSDITIATKHGDIDAGRGSKAATSIPERRVTTDLDGNTNVENIGVAAGSGIRAQSYDPDGPQRIVTRPTLRSNPDGSPLLDANGQPVVALDKVVLSGSDAAPAKGAVALIALEGNVNAGEAGIEAGNFLVIGNLIGADNISVSGASQAPAPAAAGVAGASAGLSPDATKSAVQDVANSVSQSASQPMVKPTLPSIISVDILGIGN